MKIWGKTLSNDFKHNKPFQQTNNQTINSTPTHHENQPPKYQPNTCAYKHSKTNSLNHNQTHAKKQGHAHHWPQHSPGHTRSDETPHHPRRSKQREEEPAVFGGQELAEIREDNGHGAAHTAVCKEEKNGEKILSVLRRK